MTNDPETMLRAELAEAQGRQEEFARVAMANGTELLRYEAALKAIRRIVSTRRSVGGDLVAIKRIVREALAPRPTKERT